MLGFELGILDIRGQMDSRKGQEYLKALNVCQDDEWERTMEGDRHNTVFYWIQSTVKKWNADGEMSDYAFQKTWESCADCSGAATYMTSQIYSDQPMPYITVCAILVDLHLLFEMLGAGFSWAIIQYETNGRIWLQPGMYLDVIYLFLYTAIFAMLFEVYTDVYDPFCDSQRGAADHGEYSLRFRRLALDIVHQNLPQTDSLRDVNSDSSTIIRQGKDFNAMIAQPFGKDDAKRISLLNLYTIDRAYKKFSGGNY